MARIARVTIPQVLHHVISRFVDRDWYIESDFERNRYLYLLGRALEASDWRCLAYCLMSNHIHLAMIGGELDLQSWAKKVNSPFALWLNDRRGRLGPVFADRPATFLVPRQREAEVVAYIHNNPVRANVVTEARASSWSSHQAYLGIAPRPSWLHVSEGLERTGCQDDTDGFDRLVRARAGQTLELPDVAKVRTDVRHLGPYEVGTPTLSEPVEIPIVRRRFLMARPSPTALLENVASVARMPASAVSQRYARGAVSMVKRVYIHAAVQMGISISDAAAAVNVSRQRGSKVALTPLAPAEHALVAAVIALVQAGA
jgi:hypothetical protein